MNEIPMIRAPTQIRTRPRHLADPEISSSPTPKTITDEGSGTDWAATPPMIWSTCVVGWTVSQKRKPLPLGSVEIWACETSFRP